MNTRIERDDIVKFQGRIVTKGYRDTYMAGYKNPYGPNEAKEHRGAYEEGQVAARQDNCLEGTF